MKNIVCLFLVVLCFILSGCSFLNILPTMDPERRNRDHEVDTSKLYLVREGMTREQVSEKWGEPWKKKDENHWIYYFPDIADEKIHIRYENDIAVKMWTSLENWWYF